MTRLKDLGPTVICGALIAYLLINTGVVSDDFVDIAQFRGRSFAEIPRPEGNFINVPVGHLSHHIWYRFFSLDNLVVVDLFKVGFTSLSFLLILGFFRRFLPAATALLAAFLFIFFPSHDAMPYSYAPSAHLVSIALYMYAYCLAERNRPIPAFLLALTGSFMVYGSTPIAVALFVLFAQRRELAKGLLMLVPNVIYVLYFIYVSIVAAIAPSRLLEPVTATGLFKQYALQLATFADATLGPSIWLKIYYAFFELSPLSWAVGTALVVFLVLTYRDQPPAPNRHLLIALVVLALVSFGMFAVTGRYPQLAFNLGNRTTFWGSMLLAYLLLLIPAPRPVRLAGLGVMTFVVLGISDHWKAWSTHQQAVIHQIAESQALRDYRGAGDVFVSGNQYSHFGPISHIEFMSEHWVPANIFRLVGHEHIQGRTLNRRFTFIDGRLIDRRDKSSIPVGDHIAVYDSERDRLLRVQSADINAYIAALPADTRHWLMLEDAGGLDFLRNAAVFLMPRLAAYL